jgi:hypothetical protein
MSADQNSTSPSLPWSPEARTWASLLIFAHLFAVVVAVTSYTRPSLLQGRLQELFEPYLRNLHLTAYPVTYPYARFHLTHAMVGDVDFSVEIEAQQADGSTVKTTFPPTVQPLVRFRRYQSLVDAAGTMAADESFENIAGILPKTLAGSTLRREGAPGGTIRIRSHSLPELENMASLDQVARFLRDNIEDVYAADVIVSPSSVELLRKSTTLEVAPIENSRGGRPRGGAAPRSQDGPAR